MLKKIFVSTVCALGFYPLLLAQPTVSGQVYNPSCPGYYSVSIANMTLLYSVDEFLPRDTVAQVDVIYSIRNAWTQQSWYRAPTTVVAAFDEPSGLYRADLSGVEVSSRGSYLGSHLEFALRIQTKDGRTLWDNGQRAPLGFYSASLPTFNCFPGPMETLSIDAFASSADYGQSTR